MDVEATTSSTSRRRHLGLFSCWDTLVRHPTLSEVLNRRTRAPVDLFSFYIYMRDQQRSVDYLDFWLDVSQHMTLCRHYVRGLRRSVLADTPDAEKGSKHSSAAMEVGEAYDGAGVGPSEKRAAADNRVSQVLRSEGASRHSKSNSQTSNRTSGSGYQPAPSGPARYQGYVSTSSTSPGTGQDTSGHNSSTPRNQIDRADVRASAERVLYTYLLPRSEREIILPQGIVNDIIREIEENGRDDPEVFDAAKDYVFQAMDRDAFPGFLEAKALGNLVPPSMMTRLVIGLISLFAAFWVGFVLIFLGYSRQTRCWLILPFTIGVYALNTHQWMLDPILAFCKLSEYTFMSFSRIQERYVGDLLVKRGIISFLTFFLIDVGLCCLFILVPSKHI